MLNACICVELYHIVVFQLLNMCVISYTLGQNSCWFRTKEQQCVKHSLFHNSWRSKGRGGISCGPWGKNCSCLFTWYDTVAYDCVFVICVYVCLFSCLCYMYGFTNCLVSCAYFVLSEMTPAGAQPPVIHCPLLKGNKRATSVKTCNFCACGGTRVWGLDFARCCEFLLRALQAQKWHVYGRLGGTTCLTLLL